MASKAVGVLLAVVAVMALAACGGGETKSEPAPAAAPATGAGASGFTVNMVGTTGKYEYSPDKFTVSAGDEVQFELVGDSDLHTFTVKDLKIDWDLGPGETKKFSFNFNQAGTFQVTCTPHPEMTGTVTVQ